MLTSNSARALLNKIIDEFSSATQLAVVAVDIHGKEITKPYQFTSFCKKIRTNPSYRPLCQKCDLCGGLEAAKTGVPFIYQCHAGLTDFSVPIIVQNQLVGFLSSGQVICEEQEQLPYIQETQTAWHNDQELIAAYRSVPSFSLKKIASAAELLTIISNYYLKTEMELSHNQTELSLPSDEVLNNANKEIKKSIKYINKNLNRQITLEEVSRHVYLSPFYFSKLFKQETGINFIAFVNQRKMERAKELLQNPNWTIENIAKNLGFSQTSYFCKVFRKEYNTSPKNYRDLHTNVD